MAIFLWTLICAALCANASNARAQSKRSSTISAGASASRPSGSANQLGLQLSAALRADSGTFPHQPALGVQVQLAARLPPLYAALGATYWPSGETSLAVEPSARLYGSALFADFGVGMDFPTTLIVVTPLLDVEVGQLHAGAAGIVQPERNQLLWVAVGPALAISADLWAGWFVALEMSGLMPASHIHWFMPTLAGDVSVLDRESVVWRASFRFGYAIRETEWL